MNQRPLIMKKRQLVRLPSGRFFVKTISMPIAKKPKRTLRILPTPIPK